MLLGEPSNGLVDVDLDRPEARRVATYLLPKTLVSGRESCPDGHSWYLCNPIPKSKTYKLPGEGDER